MAKESFEEMMLRLKAKIAEEKGKKSETPAPKAEEPKKEEVAPKVVEEPKAVEAPKVVETPKEEPKKEVKATPVDLPEMKGPGVEATPAPAPVTEPEKVKRGRKAKSEVAVGSSELGEIVDRLLSIVKPSKMTVRRTFKAGGEITKVEDGDSEVMETPCFVGPTATVSMNIGQTLNLGDYESCKVDIFMSVPCYLGEEDRALEHVRSFVQSKLVREVTEIKEARKK